MVTPLARGLAVLATFGGPQPWLGRQQIAQETGLPVPTVSRLLRSLVALGYLCHDEARSMYRLRAAVLGLGYAAIVDGDIQRLARAEMRGFAESTDTYVTLCTRDRLDLVVVDSCVGSRAMLALDLMPGTRMRIAGSLAGAALLAALPEQERGYLRQMFEHQTGRDWPAFRRRIAEKMLQIQEFGFCMSPGEWTPEISSVSVPIGIAGRPPWVLSCTGRTSRITRGRMERELGPRMLAIVQHIQQGMLVDASRAPE